MSQMAFKKIRKFLGLSNQVLAVIVLWIGARYLFKSGRKHWMLSLPGTFMTVVGMSYLLVAPIRNGGLNLDQMWGYTAALILGIESLWLFIFRTRKFRL
jgi:carbon starvation protein CstA